MNQEKKEKVAVFRFGVIFPLIECKVQEHWGEKERILRELVDKEWDIPFSDRRYIGKATILSWQRRYLENGRKIEALYPRDRGDRGRARSLDEETLEALVKLRLETPRLSIPRIVEIAQKRKLISLERNVSMATIYRLMKKYKTGQGKKKEDMRKYEVQMPNDLWQSDCMHGPRIFHEGKERKTYLFAILDDHSRLIPYAHFYLAENLDNYLDCLWTAMKKRGLPRKIYVDNGPSFRAHQLQLGCASLEVSLSFAKPYRPQGKGKIERFFRTVRSQFLPELPKEVSLEELNNQWDQYVNRYHSRKHGTTGQEPIKRYLEGAQLLRGAPENLPQFFRKKAVRKVNNDRTVKLDGQLFEAPLGLIGMNVTLRYENYDRIEVFLDEVSRGFLSPLDPHSNSRIYRESLSPDSHGGSLFEKSSGGK